MAVQLSVSEIYVFFLTFGLKKSLEVLPHMEYSLNSTITLKVWEKQFEGVLFYQTSPSFNFDKFKGIFLLYRFKAIGFDLYFQAELWRVLFSKSEEKIEPTRL